MLALSTIVNLVKVETFSIDNDKILGSLDFEPSDIVAIGLNDEEYTAEFLIGKTVMFAYEQDGYEVFFKGQYNSNYHWDGQCLINNYKNDVLNAATVAVFDDGIRTQYEQLLADGAEWNYTIRECKEDVNTGDTWIYSKQGDIPQTIKFDYPQNEDMYNPKTFKINISEKLLLKFYHGNTSNGKFNDTTGEACLISFSADGYVKTLYCGCIENGVYHDDSGNAWYITRNPEKSSNYEYFKGVFIDGKANKDLKNVEYLTRERIEAITLDIPYDDLKWDWNYVVD